LQQGEPWFVHGQFTPFSDAEDTYISAWSPGANYAEAPSISVRQGNIMAALVFFRLRDLPPDLPVLHAEMSIYVSGRSNDTPMTMTMRSVSRLWILKETTWLQSQKGVAWGKPGAGDASDRAAQPVATLTVDGNGWLTFDVTSLVTRWLSGAQDNEGIIINGDAANAVQYDITSSDSRDAAHRPRLVLTLPTGALALAPERAPTPTLTATPTVDPSRPASVNLLRLLPFGSVELARATLNVAGGAPSLVSAYRAADDASVTLALFRYHPAAGGGDYRLEWSSVALAGTTPVHLDMVDLTGDGQPEILVDAAAPTGSGRRLFVFTPRPADYRQLAPVGGYFDGKDYFGESGYDLADANGDGHMEILARHGNQVDVYAWDGVNFVLAP
jgi:hypothetical protein